MHCFFILGWQQLSPRGPDWEGWYVQVSTVFRLTHWYDIFRANTTLIIVTWETDNQHMEPIHSTLNLQYSKSLVNIKNN